MPQDAGRCKEKCRSPSARRCDTRSPLETSETLPLESRKLTCSDGQAKDPHAYSAFKAIFTAGTGPEGVTVIASLVYFILSPREPCAVPERIEMVEDAVGSTHNGRLPKAPLGKPNGRFGGTGLGRTAGVTPQKQHGGLVADAL